MRTPVLSIFWMFTLLNAVQAQTLESRYKETVSNLRLFPADIVRNHIPLTESLGVLGMNVQGGYIVFGVELRSKDGLEPMVSVDLPPGKRFEEGLRQVMGQIPTYEYEVISGHMINIYPVGAKSDPTDLLNTPVAKFDAVDVDPGGVLTRPADFIPELAARLRPKMPGSQGGGVVGSILRSNVPTITLHLKDTTVRQILNAASEAMEQFPPDLQPVGWVYLFQPDPESPIGGKHSWAFLFSAPRNWKPDVPKSSHFRGSGSPGGRFGPA